MRNLFDLLQRFSRSLNKDTFTKETIARVIEERTRVVLKPEDLLLKDGVLELTAGASAKNEIRLKEEAIKSELKELHKVNILRVLYK